MPGFTFRPGPHQTLPDLVAPVDEQQHLHCAPRGLPVAQQTGGQHPGVVEHQAVAGAEEVGQLIEVVVGGLPVSLLSTISREPSRRSSGVWAISSWGRS